MHSRVLQAKGKIRRALSGIKRRAKILRGKYIGLRHTEQNWQSGQESQDFREVGLRRFPKSQSGGKKVAYFTNQLIDWRDYRPRYGGGERYVLELTALLEEMGYEVDWYQVGLSKHEGEYMGKRVQLLPMGTAYGEFITGASRAFYDISLGYDYAIYNLPELSADKMRPDGITICHGIWFDHSNYSSFRSNVRKKEWIRYLRRAFRNPQAIVSVDTNSINLMRAWWPGIAKKMNYIPNFVDIGKFAVKRLQDSPDRLPVVIFPRRSHVNRGSRMLGDILGLVNGECKIYWVGEGDGEDTDIIRALSIRDKRLEYVSATFDEMSGWYERADICVIPTVASEGTSLACLEGLASGCAVVATNVGGLSDIIQDSYNGLLVKPEPEAIAQAINNLLGNEELRRDLQDRGATSALNFSKDRWRRDWINMLRQLGWETSENVIQYQEAVKENEDNGILISIVTRNAIHGGVETIINGEREGLSKNGYDVRVIVAGGVMDPYGTCPFPFTYVATYEELRAELSTSDAIIYHWPPYWAVNAIKDSGRPSVEMVHRLDTADCDATAPNVVVTHSEYLLEGIKAHYNVPIEYINNFPDPNVVQGVVLNARPTDVTVLTSLYETKGIDVLLRAWGLIQREFTDYEVAIYGDGPERQELENLARDLGVRCRFCGPVADKQSAFRNTRLFVNPSRIEGLPVAVLEAMAIGVPVLGSDIPGHREINRLSTGEHIDPPITLFPVNDVAALARSIKEVLSSPMGSNSGPTVIEKIFSPARHVGKLGDTIEQLRQNGAGHPMVQWVVVDRLLVDDEGQSWTPSQEGLFICAAQGERIKSPTSEWDEGIAIKRGFKFCARYALRVEADKISAEIRYLDHFDVRCHSGSVSITWFDGGKPVSTESEGVVLTTGVLYVERMIPSGSGRQPSSLLLEMGPIDTDEVIISEILFSSWSRQSTN